MKKEGKQSRAKWVIPVLLVALAAAAAAAVFAGGEAEEKLPWEVAGSKQPGEYTWEEFENLEGVQKDLFFESFGSADAFEQWMTAAGGPVEQTQPQVQLPWEQGGKQPESYTWEEYQNLPEEQKDPFYESFGSADDFDAWAEAAQPQTEPAETLPREEPEVPAELTWEEFTAMTPEDQEAWFESFESPEAFEAWMNKVQPAEATEAVQRQRYPWEEGGKYPSEYTWEEFLALSPDLQEAFFLSFPSPERFESWMNREKPAE